ncbi:NAD-dependent epimerase/dehydratase family protein [Kribbella shirazensis]|uniref:Nucleoside-diphosphate-sugar epimerase n=1 Tax=Kribbella shirazensis TaxID=1105143 RepID=A0A7X6A036_9ACTN|nr:NAD-dependent epimerase/dehydratase family protein [Kribbella shirazensis]NIK56796.1 nucleoside-diphosphate-sugar epimerase [Kribbella shirazensis]
MRIFIAGATGAVGRRLVPLLVTRGHEVTALSRRSPAARAIPEAATGTAGGVRIVAGDVYDAVRLREVVAAARPEVVIHQLTDLSSRDFPANNRIRREGTRNLVDAALAAGVRRVISQSIAWAYEPGAAPADESSSLDLHATDDTRRATVEAVHTLETITAEAPEWVVLRYGMLYGPDTWYTQGGLMADLATTGQLPLGPDVTSFLHVDDAVVAGAAALTWPSGPVNIVDDTPVPASTWVPAFTNWLSTTPGDAAPTYAAADSPRTPWARGATNTRARGLGWSPTHPACFSD